MTPYEVLISKTARKQLAALPALVHDKIIENISELSASPRPVGCKKIKGQKNVWRIRVGNYRVIYEVENKILHIMIIAIGHRKDIYD